jgi:ribose/xylose/arabinose/galactoside ABC-type transport system permease subunit
VTKELELPSLNRLSIFNRLSGSTYLTSIGLIGVILLMILIFSFLNSNFYSGTNLRNVTRQTSILGIVACGQTMIILSGGFDLSVGMVIGLISVLSSMIMVEYGLWAGLFAGILLGLFIGAFNGIMVAKAGLPAFIVTLAMYSAARGLALIFSGGLPITDMPPEFSFIGAGQLFTIPIPAIIAGLVFILCAIIMKKTKFGRHIYSIGGNEDAALYSGVPVANTKIGIWALHGALIGLAALVLTSRAVSGHATLGEGLELESIAATVIGGTALGRGKGSIANTFLGVVAMGILTNGLNLINVSTYYQMVAIGVIIAGAVYIDQLRSNKS